MDSSHAHPSDGVNIKCLVNLARIDKYGRGYLSCTENNVRCMANIVCWELYSGTREKNIVVSSTIPLKTFSCKYVLTVISQMYPCITLSNGIPCISLEKKNAEKEQAAAIFSTSFQPYTASFKNKFIINCYINRN